MRSSVLAITIFKSRYVAGVQCLKRLYLLVHQAELGSGKTAADFALMDQGRQVGKLARRLFPGGVEIRTGDTDDAIRITRELLANPDVPAIFEAAFEQKRAHPAFQHAVSATFEEAALENTPLAPIAHFERPIH
jgi:hypothetical protein